MKHSNIRIVGVPEEAAREKGIKMLEEIMLENFPNLVMEKPHKFRRYREPQTRRTQTDPHPDTS